jgi:hypothetical protein
MSHTTRIKDWVRMHLRLPEEVVISVNEVACRDAGCPDVETVIGILRPEQPVQILRVERPIAYVTEDHLALAIWTVSRSAALDVEVNVAASADEGCCAKTAQ